MLLDCVNGSSSAHGVCIAHREGSPLTANKIRILSATYTPNTMTRRCFFATDSGSALRRSHASSLYY
jgi:hypothetical protein